MAEPTTAHSTIIVHHLNNSRSQRILWLLLFMMQEELEIPYEIRKWDRTPEMVAPAELRQVHPLGGSPIIEDGDLVLAESGAIVEYLITKYGKGRFNPSEAGWTNNLYYTHYAEGTLMPYLVNLLVFSIVPDRAPLLVRPILRMAFNGLISQMIGPRLKLNSKMIEEHLEKKPGRFFAGGENLTSADFQMVFPLEAWLSRGSDLAPLGENTRTFVETIHARPAYKRALEKGGKYAYA
ncbi:Glutathione S-transferase, N-terminal domain [Rhizoctonia solani]|uniref:glutathione transferase n=1 Tax=Rhizoctonia solani TaxID=456999 RepID=A0A8H7IEP9_9AGAM|nr:Glutathione S-transferase, N-terminal domain [Rhizoctonia solani]